MRYSWYNRFTSSVQLNPHLSNSCKSSLHTLLNLHFLQLHLRCGIRNSFGAFWPKSFLSLQAKHASELKDAFEIVVSCVMLCSTLCPKCCLPGLWLQFGIKTLNLIEPDRHPGLAHFDPPGARGCIDELRDARVQTGPLSKDLTEVVLTNNRSSQKNGQVKTPGRKTCQKALENTKAFSSKRILGNFQMFS